MRDLRVLFGEYLHAIKYPINNNIKKEQIERLNL